MNKVNRWFVINGLLLALVTFGTIGGIAWMYSIFTFWMWFIAIISAAVVFSGIKPEEPITPSIPKWLDAGYDVLVTSILVGTGHIAMAIVYLVTMFLLQPVIIARSHQ